MAATHTGGNMKLWTTPEITLLARPHLFNKFDEKQRVCEDESESDYLSEAAGRACYWSYGKGRKTNEEYIAHIVESGHGSVLEHPTWTFGLKGISRSLSHELVRHRHLSFSQLSQRYVNEEPEFVVPPVLPTEAMAQFENGVSFAKTVYGDLLTRLSDNKQGREVARSVLPNATATRLVVTGNARSLRQMLALRGSLGADAEFRRLAVLWTKFMKQLSPNIFADFEIREAAGAEWVYTAHPKV
jgi:thymidylate synthase (FAD)